MKEQLQKIVNHRYGVPIALNGHYAYPCFVALVGSHNYGLASEDSDIDLRIGYYPSFKQFYSGKFTTPKFKVENVEGAISPIHHLVQHTLKANMNFVELWLTEYVKMDEDLLPIKYLLNKIIPMNAIRFVAANRGMAHECNKKMINSKKYDAKIASHALRCLTFTYDFIVTGKISMRASIFAKQVKLGILKEKHYHSCYSIFLDMLDKKMYVNNIYSDEFKALDKTNTEEYKHLTNNLSSLIMSVVQKRCIDKERKLDE